MSVTPTRTTRTTELLAIRKALALLMDTCEMPSIERQGPILNELEPTDLTKVIDSPPGRR